jgi:transmembrane sensor
MSVQKEIDRLIAQRAAEWFEVYRTGDTQKYPAAMAWLAESPRHMAEFLEIARRYAPMRNLLRSDPFDIDTLLKKARPHVREMRERSTTGAEEPQRRRSNARLRWTMGALAAAALIATVAVGVWKGAFSSRQHYETQIGEQRIVPLSDGSVVTLNADSRIDVRMDTRQRDIVLHGEAIFKVAHEKARPFLVHADHTTVRAVGTQFNVYARPDGSTTVAVLEGKVEVSAGSDDKAEPSAGSADLEPLKVTAKVPLAAGEMARVGRAGAIQREEKADVDSVVAWRQRRLVFDRTPLEEIVPEFNRYNRNLRLQLVDVPAGAYHYTGNFDADDPRSLALLLSEERGLKVEERDGKIVIQGRVASP